MVNKINSTPAFPNPRSGADGMTLRNWFASEAMKHTIKQTDVESPVSLAKYALAAYRIADAMMVARSADPNDTSQS